MIPPSGRKVPLVDPNLLDDDYKVEDILEGRLSVVTEETLESNPSLSVRNKSFATADDAPPIGGYLGD